MFKSLKILPFKIMKTISRIQMIFQPRTNLKIAATILPSANLVITPQTKEVIGIITKIRLTNLPRPK